MKWLRFSIATLMVFILYAGIGLTALSQVSDRYLGQLWGGAYYVATLFALAVASIMAVLSRGRAGALGVGSRIARVAIPPPVSVPLTRPGEPR
jgi:hypothetical protein